MKSGSVAQMNSPPAGRVHSAWAGKWRLRGVDYSTLHQRRIAYARDALFAALQQFRKEADADLAACLQQELAGATERYQALKNAKVPAELHLFANGGHGYGLRRTELPVTHWPDLAQSWLNTMHVLSPAERALVGQK